jgi:hypothetical protein
MCRCAPLPRQAFTITYPGDEAVLSRLTGALPIRSRSAWIRRSQRLAGATAVTSVAWQTRFHGRSNTGMSAPPPHVYTRPV